MGPDGRYVHFGLTSSDILDTALALLSPRVFVDVMFDDQNPEGRYEAIHLVAPEEPDPAKAADLAGVMIIHGNTANEDEGPAAAGAPSPEPADPTQPLLRVRVENDLISVKARGQTVAAILAQVAVLTRARLITRGTLDPEPAELDFAGAAAEALPCLIARPGVSVLVRRDREKNVSQLLELRYGVVEP